MLCSRSFYSIDVMRMVTMVGLRRATCRYGCTNMIPSDDDTTEVRPVERRGGYVFEFSVSHCDLA